jgi:hypothetical protein
MPVTSGLHEDAERVPVLIHCSPEIMVPAVHGEHDVVQVPCVSTSRVSAPKGLGLGVPERERPLPDGFIADDHPTRGQNFFDIPEASRETNVAPHRVADDLGRISLACRGIPLLIHRQHLADFSFFGKLTVPSSEPSRIPAVTLCLTMQPTSAQPIVPEIRFIYRPIRSTSPFTPHHHKRDRCRHGSPCKDRAQ